MIAKLENYVAKVEHLARNKLESVFPVLPHAGQVNQKLVDISSSLDRVVANMKQIESGCMSPGAALTRAGGFSRF